MSYETIASGGDVFYATRTYKIFLYPNDSGVDDDIDGALKNGAESLGDQLLNNGIIDYYSVNKWTGGYLHRDDSSAEAAKDGMRAFLDNNNITRKGSHVLAHDTTAAGYAEDADSSGLTAFSREKAASVGVDYWAVEQHKNLIIHECCHTIIREDLDSVRALHDGGGTDGNKDDRTHALGKVRTDLLCTSSTPFIIGYEESLSEVGDCVDWDGTNDCYNEYMTQCTIDAIDYSEEAEP